MTPKRVAPGDELKVELQRARDSYTFPAKTYDFRAEGEVVHPTSREVETSISTQLRSERLEDVRDGLSNVLYWGYGTSKGRRKHRVHRFRSEVAERDLSAFSDLVKSLSGPGLVAIHALGLPQFSGASFISKVRMFLDPANYVVLDLKLAQLRTIPGTIIDGLASVGTQIRVTPNNELVYERWSEWCRRAALLAFGPGIPAVDAERAVFQLVNQDRRDLAAKIILALQSRT
jgi:hypothetical protein